MIRREQAINDFPQSSSITAIELIKENNPADVNVIADVIMQSSQNSRSKHDGNLQTRAINSYCQISSAATKEIADQNSQIDVGEAADIVISLPVCSGSNFRGRYISFAGFEFSLRRFSKEKRFSIIPNNG